MREVRGVFTLPLYPLQGAVLLPGERVSVPWGREAMRAILERARGFGGVVVASLADGESVHEVGVTAMVSDEGEGDAALHGISRCRLLSLASEDVTLVRAESYPEGSPAGKRGTPVARLLLSRYSRLCQRLGKALVTPARRQDLSAVTWRITADLGLSAEEQQGFLNVPDPLTRGKLLLLALRELERRERFLRRWTHLRTTTSWN
jgi:Lon protease-like protein